MNDFQKHPLEVEEQHMFFIFVEVVTPVIAKRQKNMNIWGLAKSGPLDFPLEKSFLLFSVHEKGLGHMFQK